MRQVNWRKIPMSLIDAEKGEGKSHTCAMAFHEKAGLSQVDLVVSSLNKVFSLPPSRHCRHPSIRTLDERCALGACWAFSVQPVLPSVWRPDPIRWSVFAAKYSSSVLPLRC
jgi:hypothetical protein